MIKETVSTNIDLKNAFKPQVTMKQYKSETIFFMCVYEFIFALVKNIP